MEMTTAVPAGSEEQGLAERSAEAMALLASPEMLEFLRQLKRSAPALTHTVRRVERLHATGTLDTVMDVAEVGQAALATMSDGMIARIADNGRALLELADMLMSTGIAERAPALLKAAGEARDIAVADKNFVGPIDALMAPREPELQFMLKFMLAFARLVPGALQIDTEVRSNGR